MKFVWNNPVFILEKPLGYKPVGLKKNNERPDNIYFTISEVNEIFESKWDYVKQFLAHTIKKVA